MDNPTLPGKIFKFDHFLEMVFEDVFDEGNSNGIQLQRDQGGDMKVFDQSRVNPLVYCLQDLGGSWILDFQEACERNERGEVLQGIICFPLKPKPHQLDADHFLRVMWRGGGDR